MTCRKRKSTDPAGGVPRRCTGARTGPAARRRWPATPQWPRVEPRAGWRRRRARAGDTPAIPRSRYARSSGGKGVLPAKTVRLTPNQHICVPIGSFAAGCATSARRQFSTPSGPTVSSSAGRPEPARIFAVTTAAVNARSPGLPRARSYTRELNTAKLKPKPARGQHVTGSSRSRAQQAAPNQTAGAARRTQRDAVRVAEAQARAVVASTMPPWPMPNSSSRATHRWSSARSAQPTRHGPGRRCARETLRRRRRGVLVQPEQRAAADQEHRVMKAGFRCPCREPDRHRSGAVPGTLDRQVSTVITTWVSRKRHRGIPSGRFLL